MSSMVLRHDIYRSNRNGLVRLTFVQMRGISVGQQLVGKLLPVFDSREPLIERVEGRVEPRQVDSIGWRLGEIAAPFLGEDLEIASQALGYRAQDIFGLACSSQAQQPAKSAGLNDAQIAAVVVAANAIDAEMGDLAAERGSAASIRQFGKTMATDHRAVNKAAGDLVARLKVVPLENGVSEKLRADAAAFRAELIKKKGAAFDRAYIAHEVEYHKAVIAAVDQLLIPSATNAELKETLIGVRPALVAHLEHAEHLLAGLK